MQHNLSGGGGVRKNNNFNKGGKLSLVNLLIVKIIYLLASVICSLSDDEVTTRTQNQNNHQNGYNNRGSCERKRSVTILWHAQFA